MSYIVTENCIKCKFTDCVNVCPVDCFYEGENFLVINPDECIDCAVCVPECPINAIISFDENINEVLMFNINKELSNIWPKIKKSTLIDKDNKWNNIKNKLHLIKI